MKWSLLVIVLCLVCATENAQDKGKPRVQEPRVLEPRVLEPRVLEPGVLPGTEGLQFLESTEIVSSEASLSDGGPDPSGPHYPVQHAGQARNLYAVPLPLKESDHELTFNVSWLPPLGPPARDYSLEVHSETDTEDCRMTMCYEYNIPGSATWWMIPARASPIHETCAVRPGCAYRIKLLSHPWDGLTVAAVRAQLDECVAGVCSCAHKPRLPAPRVQAEMVTVTGEGFVNITWTLPPPVYPQRLPKRLHIQFYYVSIGEQLVSDAHPAPWFSRKITRHVPASGLIAGGDGPRYYLMPTADRKEAKILKDVKLLARVSVVDERGCFGPEGNATAYDPAKALKGSIDTYVLWLIWLALGALLLLCVAACVATGAGVVKRVLRALRPAPALALTPQHGWRIDDQSDLYDLQVAYWPKSRRDKIDDRKKPCRNLCGTAPTGPQHLLRPAIPSTQLYVSRLHYTTKAEEVVEYVRMKTGFTLRLVTHLW